MVKKKNRFRLLAVLALALACLLCFPASAAGKPVDIYINGGLLNIPPSFGAPFYDENSRLQIPMRYIIESCGYDVVWNNAQQTATVPTQSGDVVITLGSQVLHTPGGEVTMDTSAVALDNRTYIPLRFALEALGFQVTWTGGAASDRVDITGQTGAASSRVPMTAAEVAAMASPATFYIEVSDASGAPYAGGSGFFIDPSGVGVTNYHVIEGASRANVTTVDGKVYDMSMVLYYDVERDLAVFSVLSEPGAAELNVPYLSLAHSSSIHNGDVVYAIGSPLGLQNSITDGLVSNKDRTLPGDTRTYIQTSAPISHGNSGGPLLNQYGEVVGINTAGLEGGQNLNFAIPSSDLAAVNYGDSAQWLTLSQVADREQVLQPPANLRIVRRDESTVYLQWDPVEGAEYYHFYYQEAGDESYWYDEDTTYGGPARFTYNADYSVRYYGLEKGHVYNVVVTAVKGGAESADSRVLTFQFTGAEAVPAGQSGTVPSYAKADWLPDFGAIYGLTPTYQSEQDGSVIYFYDVPDFSYIEGYYDILFANGFVFDGRASDEFAGANAPMFFYLQSANQGVLTDIDPDTGEFIVFFVYE